MFYLPHTCSISGGTDIYGEQHGRDSLRVSIGSRCQLCLKTTADREAQSITNCYHESWRGEKFCSSQSTVA